MNTEWLLREIARVNFVLAHCPRVKLTGGHISIWGDVIQATFKFKKLQSKP